MCCLTDAVLCCTGQVWLMRHLVAVRLVRMGWNVFVIDADIIFLTDPYR